MKLETKSSGKEGSFRVFEEMGSYIFIFLVKFQYYNKYLSSLYHKM